MNEIIKVSLDEWNLTSRRGDRIFPTRRILCVDLDVRKLFSALGKIEIDLS